MAEGATGATRAGGAASSDSFSKREKANEDMAIKNREREKLMALKAKVEAQQKHLKDLSDHIDQMSVEQEGSEKK
ncbi:MAG: hypothetical protein LQ340_000742 [Diploschistes diacapsis]|nr:MAG: hypothetical protein LQ340_000742 [Diploschistes diacapsis]